MKETTFRKYCVLLASILVMSGIASANNFPKEGNFDFTSCWSGVNTELSFSRGYSGTTYEMTGTQLSNPPGGIFDKNTFRCVGMNTMINGKLSSSNICEAVDADGHKRLTQFYFKPDGTVVREMVAGTGKYEGMTMTTTVTTLGTFNPIKSGTFQGCNRQTGTYKMK